MKKMLASAMALMIISSLPAQQSFVSDRLAKKWETPAQLKVPESVCFDASRNVIYVSNVAGSPTDKDGNGFISQVSPEGQITVLEWVKGLNAPKGMGIAGDFLYVSDITRVVKIDIAQGKIAGEIEIPGSKFLNDITIDQQGTVYVSDMNGNAIYTIKGAQHKLLVKSDKLNGPNGLFFTGDKLLAGLQDRVVAVDIKTGEFKDYITNTGGIDGIVPDGQGNYLISDWLGNIHLISPDKAKIKLLDTTPENINAADIDFVVSKKLLLVPTFSDNRVVAYELK
jgi:outer membrane protein assembly factor BamB